MFCRSTLRQVPIYLQRYLQLPRAMSSAQNPDWKPNGEKRAIDQETDDAENSKKLKTEGTASGLPEATEGRKKSVALLIGYNGKGYYGLQFNKGFKTIEAEIFKALLAAVVIPQAHHDEMQKMSFKRAARTDKGVSAVRNVVSLKIISDDVVKKLNDELPAQIRVFDCTRTTKSFNCQKFCCGRTYSYTTPTFAFAPVEENVTPDYRITEDIIQSVNSILKLYLGTHNFHNFTSGIKPEDKSAFRYMISFECGKPWVMDGMEFITLTVRGQSFMLHHIRKMIGLTIAIQKGFCGVETVERAWRSDKVDIPKAPGLGLLLEELDFRKYNQRFGDDGVHQKLEWNHLKETVETFKSTQILPDIVRTEKEENSMINWLATLTFHSYETPTGTLPVILGQRSKKEKKEDMSTTDADQDPASPPSSSVLSSECQIPVSDAGSQQTSSDSATSSAANQNMESESSTNQNTESSTNQKTLSESSTNKNKDSESPTNQNTEPESSLAANEQTDKLKPEIT